MMMVRNYPGIADWPPMPGGAFTRVQKFPQDQKVLITKIFPVVNEFVTFTYQFDGAEHTYDLQLTDETMAQEYESLARPPSPV